MGKIARGLGDYTTGLNNYAVECGKAEQKDAERWKADKISTPQQRVNTILRKLGEPYYHEFLRKTFAGKRGKDGKRFTPIHAALLNLNFRGFVTTNYDPALDFARAELRTESVTTGTPTWYDIDEVNRWLTGDIFRDPTDCPILWAHGYWQRPDTIVLNSGEYGQAYKPSLYRHTFQRLWLQDHLVFIGFSFSDPQFTFMVGEMLRDTDASMTIPRHIAILGIDADSMVDKDIVKEWCENLETDYHARPLFYPIGLNHDHSALQVLLDSLAPISTSFSSASYHPPPTILKTAFKAKWYHQATDDEIFLGREEEEARLNRWVADSAVHVIGICAVGGVGKTALVGHWLKQTEGWKLRPFERLFAWSFYQERNIKTLFLAMLEWANISPPSDPSKLIATVLNLLESTSFMLVLDGLEVLQEGPDDTRHGRFLNGLLREFLIKVCNKKHDSLVILTSRFVFADLERFLGKEFHQLELSGLTEEQGSALLGKMEVGGTELERQKTSIFLEGHSLGLRLFAETLPYEQNDTPMDFLSMVFTNTNLNKNSELTYKIQKILSFYEKSLTETQVNILSVVSIFRTPVDLEVLELLIENIFQECKLTLISELMQLYRQKILTREPLRKGFGYSCHPVLRDYFREILIQKDKGHRAANLLIHESSFSYPKNLDGIEFILDIISLLLDSNNFSEAHDLYRNRLDDGYIFMDIPALKEGAFCSSLFNKYNLLNNRMIHHDYDAIGFYLNDESLFRALYGDYESSLKIRNMHLDYCKRFSNELDLSLGMQNYAIVLLHKGEILKASTILKDALSLALDLRGDIDIIHRFIYLGWANLILGELENSIFSFLNAKILNGNRKIKKITSLNIVFQCEFYIRTGHISIVEKIMAAEIAKFRRYEYNDELARCYWIFGWCNLIEGKFDEAKKLLYDAEVIFSGQMLFDLARVYVTQGELALVQNEPLEALRKSQDALDIAKIRGMKLVHADALIIQAKALLISKNFWNAQDSAEEAMQIARDSGYLWAERDALLVLSQCLLKIKEQNKMKTRANSITANLTINKSDIDKIVVKSKLWVKAFRDGKHPLL